MPIRHSADLATVPNITIHLAMQGVSSSARTAPRGCSRRRAHSMDLGFWLGKLALQRGRTDEVGEEVDLETGVRARHVPIPPEPSSESMR